MFYFVFIFVFLCVLSYFIFCNKVNVFSFFFICLTVYFSPLFFGFVNEPYGRYVKETNIEPMLYIFGSYVFILCSLFDFLSKVLFKFHNVEVNLINKSDKKTNTYLFGFFLIVCISFAIQYITGGDALFSNTKSDVLDAQSRWTILNVTSSMLAIVYCLLVRKEKVGINNTLLKLVFILSLISLAFNIYIGHRSNAAVAFLAFSLAFFYNEKITYILRVYSKQIVIMLFFAFFFYIYKFIYIAVKMNNFELVFNNLIDPSFYIKAFSYSEPFTIQGIFNSVIRNNYTSECTNIIYLPLSFLPSLDKVFDLMQCKFNTLLQRDLFPEVPYGVGSNLWAEFYSLQGVLSFVTLSIFYYSIILFFIYLLLRNSNLLIKSAIFVCLAYLCFYSNRKDLFLLFGIIKRVSYTCIIIYIYSLIVDFMVIKRK